MPVFIPVGLYELGVGAASPAIVLLALELGASETLAAAILALMGIGQVLADLPASSLAARIGDRRAMLIAAGVSIVAAGGAAASGNLLVLAAATMLFGTCNAVFYLARQTFVTAVAHPSIMGTSMSTMGGAHRVGLVIGPLCGAVAVSFGGLRAAFVVTAIVGVVAIAFLLPDHGLEREFRSSADNSAVSWRSVVAKNRRVLTTLGVAVAAIGAVRAAKVTVLPLWAYTVGMSAEMTNVVVAVSAALELAVFYPAGRAMDRFGRSWIVVPAMALLGAALIALSLASSTGAVFVVAAVLGIGNGLGSGIVMILAADVSTEPGRTKFIGLWRVLSDTGAATGPAAISVIAGGFGLAVAIGSLGGLGVLTAATLAVLLPIYTPYATSPPRRRR